MSLYDDSIMEHPTGLEPAKSSLEGWYRASAEADAYGRKFGNRTQLLNAYKAFCDYQPPISRVNGVWVTHMYNMFFLSKKSWCRCQELNLDFHIGNVKCCHNTSPTGIKENGALRWIRTI